MIIYMFLCKNTCIHIFHYLQDFSMCSLVLGLPHHTLSLFLVLLLCLRILISLSGCSPPGLRGGQIVRLFISLAINITRCTAAFSGNNCDNSTTALLSLFLSLSSPCHFCEKQAHSFISRPFGISLLFFQTSFHLC